MFRLPWRVAEQQQAACRDTRCLLFCCLLLTAGCGEAPLSVLDPATASARHIVNVWNAMAGGAAFILLLMLALAIAAVWTRPTACTKRTAMRSRWLLIGGGIMLPLGSMAAILVYAYGMERATADPSYRVQVTAHQWWWEVHYPEAAGGARYSVNDLHVPAQTTVTIELNAVDVIHGFWVPRLGGKMDAIPGRNNRLVYVVPEPGTYHGTCAEYCGVGHATMRLRVVAHEQGALEAVLSSLPLAPQKEQQ